MCGTRWGYACEQGGLFGGMVHFLVECIDMNIAQQWLIYELDEVVLADRGYKDGGQYFIMPSG